MPTALYTWLTASMAPKARSLRGEITVTVALRRPRLSLNATQFVLTPLSGS